MTEKETVKVTAGSGNVFADLGIPNPEEALAKAELVREISRNIADRELTQAEAGRILGIGQPRVSELLRGRVSVFSLEKLIEFAKRLGDDVEITIHPAYSYTSSLHVVFGACAVAGAIMGQGQIFAGKSRAAPDYEYEHSWVGGMAERAAPPLSLAAAVDSTLVAA